MITADGRRPWGRRDWATVIAALVLGIVVEWASGKWWPVLWSGFTTLILLVVLVLGPGWMRLWVLTILGAVAVVGVFALLLATTT